VQLYMCSVEITNRMQPCNKIDYSKIYWRLSMFWAAHRSSSGSPNCICSLWSSWWWAVCRLKHVEPSIYFGIINSFTRLHLVGYFNWFILRRTDPWILNKKKKCIYAVGVVSWRLKMVTLLLALTLLVVMHIVSCFSGCFSEITA
jgi:hypothetical protein